MWKTIEYNDEYITVRFDHYEAEEGDYETPGSPSKIVIKEICHATQFVSEESIKLIILNEIER
tara:strand:+ start:1527 stop:1715 length:189 start_codon:yes stop_codon:yes gene_type:complete